MLRNLRIWIIIGLIITVALTAAAQIAADRAKILQNYVFIAPEGWIPLVFRSGVNNTGEVYAGGACQQLRDGYFVISVCAYGIYDADTREQLVPPTISDNELVAPQGWMFLTVDIVDEELILTCINVNPPFIVAICNDAVGQTTNELNGNSET